MSEQDARSEQSGEGEARLRYWRSPFRPVRQSLSRQLLLLTILFVMIGEVLIFLPSVANFRVNYLEQRLGAAQIATLALEATPNNMVSPELREELLANAQSFAIVLHRDATRRPWRNKLTITCKAVVDLPVPPFSLPTTTT